MPDCVYEKCCGCIELRTGCLIIGYLELVGEIIISLLVLLMLIGGGVGLSAHDHAEAQGIGGVLLIMGGVFLLIVGLLLAFTITLLVGLHKNKRNHVKAYLIYSAIFLVISFIMYFVDRSRPEPAKDVVLQVLIFFMHAYFLLVIRSYYLKMGESNKRVAYNAA